MCLWKKEIIQSCRDTGSELAPLPGDLECHCGPVRVDNVRSQVVNAVLARCVEQWAPRIPKSLLEWLPQLQTVNPNRPIQQPPESSHWFPDLWSMGQEESTRSVQSTSRIWKDGRAHCYHQKLERCRGGDSQHIPIQLTSLTWENDSGFSQAERGGDSTAVAYCTRRDFPAWVS